ncbi:Putative restriction endonuclease [Nocardiopsis flavescens]|uniref:Putative restriction endonuclease n=1 Tax=Nocardiopsis flavescens TaxID=758803 RepID=A0A1M6FYJ3_9ACTN|nr:Uma2 family endonuclease [Nocardiopsis flavescens]SHJ02684.1 Putative restriction endonuclease [Nocardiopsis flavescens]
MATVSDENDPTIGDDMSAPTVAAPSAREFGPEVTVPLPPEDGFVAGDLDRIPDLPPHTELIDGSLVLVSPQKRFHMRMLRSLELQLLDQVPPDLIVEREMTTVLRKDQRPEPDLMLISTDDPDDLDVTWVAVEDVRLAIEVVSPESRTRDLERKPQLYAGAGIPHFWLIEQEEGEAAGVAHVYELDPVRKEYVATGVHRRRLKVTVPCELDLDLADLSWRRDR